jgi:hypothetical protein
MQCVHAIDQLSSILGAIHCQDDFESFIYYLRRILSSLIGQKLKFCELKNILNMIIYEIKNYIFNLNDLEFTKSIYYR